MFRPLVFAIAPVGGVTACFPENAQANFQQVMAYENGEDVTQDNVQALA